MDDPHQQGSSEMTVVMAWGITVQMPMEMVLVFMTVKMDMGPAHHQLL
jgi:hypothetical protein